MDREEELKQIEQWERQQVEILINKVDNYCNQYSKIRRKVIKFVDELNKMGLEVENWTIEKKGQIK